MVQQRRAEVLLGDVKIEVSEISGDIDPTSVARLAALAHAAGARIALDGSGVAEAVEVVLQGVTLG